MTDQRRQQTDRYAQQLLAIEQAAVRACIVRLVYTLAAIRREARGRVLAAQSAAAAQQAARALGQQLEAQARALLEPDPLLAAVQAEAQRAIDLATVYTLGEATTVRLAPETEVDRAMRSAIATAGDRIEKAVTALERSTTAPQIAAAIRIAGGAVESVGTGAEYAVNAAANSAPRRIAIARGQQLVWVAERDACVVCLALSGDVIDPFEGESFDETATFGVMSPPAVWPPGMPLSSPPRHPHCRCIVQVWDGSVVPGFLSWPQRLKHEALRSVARGWSLPSESRNARLHAAARILRDGRAEELPKSVRAEAVRAIARGRFTSRTVPRHRTNVR